MRVFSLVALCTAAAAAESGTSQAVTFFLKQQGASRIIEEALLVSDPASDRYGDFLSFDEVVALQRPPAGHLQKVHDYLDSMGASDRHVSVAGDKVVAMMQPAAVSMVSSTMSLELESVLDGVMVPSKEWLSTRPDERLRRERLAGLLSSQGNISRLAAGGPPACLSPLTGVTPTCLRSAYGLGDTAASHPKNLQAVIVNEDFKPSDLQAFEAKYNLPDQKVVKLVNGQLSGSAATEASLDMQYIIGMGRGTPTWWFHLNGAESNPFAEWLTYMSNNSDIPLVQSLSVGAPENAVGNALVARMNTEMAALGARGVTIVFASGDNGYVPNQKFGAGSPFVTAVGGVWRGDTGDDDFLSVDGISTGGFSSLTANAAPSWQTAAVSAYMKTSGDRPAGLDASKRCVPDFSLYDDGLQVFINGGQHGEGGTSCSAPVASGMFSLINDALLKAGHSPLGMVNPLLYANQDAFLDITRGNNGGVLGSGGFEAVKGYDPASGLGTFDENTFGKLMNAAKVAKEAASQKRAAARLIV